MVFKDFRVLVHWANEASAVEGLIKNKWLISFYPTNVYKFSKNVVWIIYNDFD